MTVRAFTHARYHGKAQVGSTRLRVKQLMKYWPEYAEYKYGEQAEVMVYQKVYIQKDWGFMDHFKGIQILDICDPDWFEQQHVKQTLDAVDGAVCPTEPMAEFLRQLTDKPVKVIPDRHDVEGIPLTKVHEGKIKSAVWFGYSHNSEVLKFVIPTLIKRGISLTVISNENPYPSNKGLDYRYKHFDEDTILDDLAQHDICVLPQGVRPKDRFKSNNKTTLAWLAGIPVVTDLDSLDAMESPEARNKQALACYNEAIEKYDVKLSVKEMKEFIEELKSGRTQRG